MLALETMTGIYIYAKNMLHIYSGLEKFIIEYAYFTKLYPVKWIS